MSTLPPDVLHNIFHQVIKRKPFIPVQRRPYYGIDSIPLRISHVCRFWRDMTLSCGSFWSHLALQYVYLGRGGLLPLKRKFELFETCLRRTIGCPLNFSVCILFNAVFGRREVAKEARRMAERIIESLLSEHHRWQTVHFDWRCVGLSEGFRDIRIDSMPELRSLDLSSCLCKENSHGLPVTVDLAKSTHLRHLRLGGTFLLEFGEEPMHRLTEWSELDFGESERASTTCLDLLRAAPNLKQLHVLLYGKIMEPPQTPDGELQGSVLHDLLSLSFNGGDMMPFTTNKVSFRSLKALRFSDSCGGLLFMRFMAQQSPLLTCLEVYIVVDSNHLIEVLRVVSTLRDLRTVYATASELRLFIDALAAFDQTGDSTIGNSATTNVDTICPFLHSLHINMSSGLVKIGTEFVECIASIFSMLELRRAVLNTFQRIRLPGNKINSVIEMQFTPEDCTKLSQQALESNQNFHFQAEGDGVEPYPFAF